MCQKGTKVDRKGTKVPPLSAKAQLLPLEWTGGGRFCFSFSGFPKDLAIGPIGFDTEALPPSLLHFHLFHGPPRRGNITGLTRAPRNLLTQRCLRSGQTVNASSSQVFQISFFLSVKNGLAPFSRQKSSVSRDLGTSDLHIVLFAARTSQLPGWIRGFEDSVMQIRARLLAQACE